MTDLVIARSDPTAREIELVEHLANGRRNVEIAELMGIRPATVKAHIVRISARLGLDGKRHPSGHLRAEIVLECFCRGLIR